jgi:sulfite exporter TauE/SafE
VALFFFIGLLGGAHCLGMCGPLVTIYASKMDPARTDGGAPTRNRRDRSAHLTLFEVRQHVLFNLGRATSYTLLGALLGALGGLFYFSVGEVTAAAKVVRGVVGVGIGAGVMVIGGHYVLGRISVGVQLPGTQRVMQRLTSLVERLANGPGIAGLGALHGLLPCPILYPAYLYAFASGSPLSGGIALAALGLGTIPAVFAYGTIIESVDATHRRRLHRVLGVAFLALGYVLLAHGLMSLGIHIPHPMLPFWNPLDSGMMGVLPL